MNVAETIYEARRVSVPLVYIVTDDPKACIRKLELGKALNNITIDDPEEMEKEGPVVTWDLVQGMMGKNQAGKIRMVNQGIKTEDTKLLTKALTATVNLETNATAFFFMLTPEIFLRDPVIVQTIWNLRDELKVRGIILIFLGPDVTLPPGLNNDILKLNDPRPNRQEFEDKINRQYEALKEINPNVAEMTTEDCTRAALSLQGLSMFPAETAIAMSFRMDGIDFPTLKEQRYAKIERQGLKVWKGTETFADVKGLDGIAQLLYRMVTSKKKRAGAIFYLDELDKELAGVGGGDLSGMADKYLGALLTYMEDNKVPGALLVGHPGCGKTEISKALGNETGLMTMAMDLGLMKSSLMGSSEHNLREVFDIATAVSGGVPFFLASCNSAEKLPTSLLRRFRIARVFFDLPTRAAKDAIWQVKLLKYQLPEQTLPDDDLWTGSEIEVCCERAWLFDCSLIEAAKSVIPVAKSRPEEVKALREAANGKYLDAATGTVYSVLSVEDTKKRSSERQVKLTR